MNRRLFYMGIGVVILLLACVAWDVVLFINCISDGEYARATFFGVLGLVNFSLAIVNGYLAYVNHKNDRVVSRFRRAERIAEARWRQMSGR